VKRRRPGRPDAGTGRRASCDSGSGTVLALGLVAVLASLVLVCAALGAAIVARHRAAAAADLAALAAADRSLGRAPGVPCAVAGEVTQANDARLTGCRVDGDGSVIVRVRVRLPAPWARLGVAEAAARAGSSAHVIGPVLGMSSRSHHRRSHVSSIEHGRLTVALDVSMAESVIKGAHSLAR
jgi:secretion/DNA translocation related TadE-like protein